MRFTAISEIAELSDGIVIEGLRGTVEKVAKRYTGTHDEYGPWSLQAIKLTDGAVSVNVNVAGKDDLNDLKGKFVCLLSGKDKKGKVSGLSAFDKEYQGKISRVVKTNGLMEITETIPAGQLQQPAPKEQPADQLAETAAQRLIRERKEAEATGKPLPTTTNHHHPTIALARLGQRAHLLFLCRKASFAVAVECHRLEPLNECVEASIHAMAVTLFISAEREGLDKDLSSNFLKPDAPAKPKPAAPPTPPPLPVEEDDDPPF